MDSLVSTFHLDLGLFLAQAVNFAIVLAVLYYFAFKPIAKVMNERSEKIEKSLADAKEIEAKLADTEKERQEVINEAKKAASLLLEEANRRQGRRINRQVSEIVYENQPPTIR